MLFVSHMSYISLRVSLHLVSPRTFRFTRFCPLYRVSREQPRFLFIIDAKWVRKNNCVSKPHMSLLSFQRDIIEINGMWIPRGTRLHFWTRENGVLRSIRFSSYSSFLKNRHAVSSSRTRLPLIVSAVTLVESKCGRDEECCSTRVSACTRKCAIHLHTYHVPAPTVQVAFALPIYMSRLGCSWAHFAYLRTWFRTRIHCKDLPSSLIWAKCQRSFALPRHESAKGSKCRSYHENYQSRSRKPNFLPGKLPPRGNEFLLRVHFLSGSLTISVKYLPPLFSTFCRNFR